MPCMCSAALGTCEQPMMGRGILRSAIVCFMIEIPSRCFFVFLLGGAVSTKSQSSRSRAGQRELALMAVGSPDLQNKSGVVDGHADSGFY